MTTSEGMLKPDMIFKTATGDIWYVSRTSQSGAYCIHLSAHFTPITTRKGVTKIVKRHLPNSVFSLRSVVDLVDKSSLDPVQLRRRIKMARKDETPATGATDGAVAETKPAAEKVARVANKYLRTDKVPAKELRGQSKEVMDAFNAANGDARSAEEIAGVCVFAGSRQDKVRVAAFYIAQFKKEGYLKVAEVAAAAPVSA